jgi:hypothetical protein
MRIFKKNAIRAYKVFNPDWTCRGFQYKVGEKYKCAGEIEPCVKGFHCCQKLVDCFNYYTFNPRNKVADVEIWGSVEQSGDKLCASNIKIIKELDWHTVLNLVNTGDCNIGMYNSGNHNFGYRNSGDGNLGYCNSGCRNSGCHNSGNLNSGNWNSGSWNSGDRNSGYFNTSAQNVIFCFNKPTKNEVIKFPDFLYFNLIEWVCVEDMTDKEKEEHPEHITTGGFLRRMAYKEAFRKSFESAKKEENWQKQLAELKAIPNFNSRIFYEISGIKPEELV